ncbi:MAG: hypothetical protein Tsb0017_06180 [Geothermobacteraceae bacterium]
MCRVLGITRFNLEQHRPIINRFCKLARSGMVMEEDPPGHEDGWGLAFYRGGNLVVHKSGLSLLDERDRLFTILEKEPTSPALVLHLRKSAWTGTSNTRHAHPFHRGNTVFFHNGVVYDYQALLPQIGDIGLPDDARDTEILFHHILSRKADDLGQKFLRSAEIIQDGHRYSALNCLFSDGKKLYAYRDFTREEAYYALFRARAAGSWLISSEPLDENLNWELMDKREFLQIEL